MADDDRTARTVLDAMARLLDWDATLCSDGTQVLSALNEPEAAFDALILDHLMPGMTGASLVHWMRADLRWSHTPVVLVTSQAKQVGVMGLVDYPHVCVLSKPTDAVALNLALSRMMHARASG